MYKHLLFINKNIQDYEIFVSSLKSNIDYILVDANTDIENDMLSLTEKSYENIGIIQHGYNDMILIGNKKLILQKKEGEAVYECPDLETNELVIFLKTLVSKYSVQNIDLIACSILHKWKSTLDKLETQLSVNIRASDDATGNLKYGGDWVQESDDVNIAGIYFTQMIDNYEHLLWWGEEAAAAVAAAAAAALAAITAPAAPTVVLDIKSLVGGVGDRPKNIPVLIITIEENDTAGDNDNEWRCKFKYDEKEINLFGTWAGEWPNWNSDGVSLGTGDGADAGARVFKLYIDLHYDEIDMEDDDIEDYPSAGDDFGFKIIQTNRGGPLFNTDGATYPLYYKFHNLQNIINSTTSPGVLTVEIEQSNDVSSVDMWSDKTTKTINLLTYLICNKPISETTIVTYTNDYCLLKIPFKSSDNDYADKWKCLISGVDIELPIFNEEDQYEVIADAHDGDTIFTKEGDNYLLNIKLYYDNKVAGADDEDYTTTSAEGDLNFGIIRDAPSTTQYSGYKFYNLKNIIDTDDDDDPIITTLKIAEARSFTTTGGADVALGGQWWGDYLDIPINFKEGIIDTYATQNDIVYLYYKNGIYYSGIPGGLQITGYLPMVISTFTGDTITIPSSLNTESGDIISMSKHAFENFITETPWNNITTIELPVTMTDIGALSSDNSTLTIKIKDANDTLVLWSSLYNNNIQIDEISYIDEYELDSRRINIIEGVLHIFLVESYTFTSTLHVKGLVSIHSVWLDNNESLTLTNLIIYEGGVLVNSGNLILGVGTHQISNKGVFINHGIFQNNGTLTTLT